VYDVKVIAEEIGFPIRKLLENTLLYPVMDQTKTRKTSAYRIGNQTQCVFHAIWTCYFSMRAPTRNHSISWKIIDSPLQN
jgi:hypothetical protein